MTGEEEAYVIALWCSEPPEGRATWTLRLLADKMVAGDIVDSLSHETVRQTLKKRNQTLAKARMVSPTTPKRRLCLPNGVREKLALSPMWQLSPPGATD